VVVCAAAVSKLVARFIDWKIVPVCTVVAMLTGKNVSAPEVTVFDPVGVVERDEFLCHVDSPSGAEGVVAPKLLNSGFAVAFETCLESLPADSPEFANVRECCRNAPINLSNEPAWCSYRNYAQAE
jgi:hypothetical protein